MITDPNDLGLTSVHASKLCQGRPCPMHNPTAHRLANAEVIWRTDRGILERICEHGVGHPDRDQAAYWQEIGEEWRGIHGCCHEGCCAE